MAGLKANRRLLAAGAGIAGAGATAGFAAHRVLARRIAADPEAQALRWPAAGRPQTVVSADGTRLHVETFEADSQATVVLVHGWTETIAVWTYVIRQLRENGISVVAYDLRGHGQSGRAGGGTYALARFGEDLEAVLAQCVPGGRAVLAGHSLGAMSIAAWAESHDVCARAAAAVLTNTGVGDLISESLLLPVPAVAKALGELIAVRGFLGSRAPLPRVSTPVSHAAIRYAAFGPAATPAQVAFFERLLVATPPDVRADAGIAMSEMELHESLSRLTIPTAVIAGAKDRLTPPSHARRIAEMLPQLHRLTVLEGVGHMALLERPQAVVDVITELANQTSSAPAPVR